MADSPRDDYGCDCLATAALVAKCCGSSGVSCTTELDDFVYTRMGLSWYANSEAKVVFNGCFRQPILPLVSAQELARPLHMLVACAGVTLVPCRAKVGRQTLTGPTPLREGMGL